MTPSSKPVLLIATILGLVLAPGPALAQQDCSSHPPACPEGQTYDTTTQTCIQPLNS